MRIVILGANGQLGTALREILTDAVALSHAELDITDEIGVRQRLGELTPQVVINTAAYNWVDRAEEEPEPCFAVNAFGPRTLARACAERGITLVHFSTDYVFGRDTSRTTPYQENDIAGPLGVYGTSKLAGEKFVQAICPQHYVLRTCGLYGWSTASGKQNFVEKMLALGEQRGEVSVVNDQTCTPTFTCDLARAVADLLPTGQYGLYHVTNTGAATWYEFACEIFRLAGRPVHVRPVGSHEFATAAQRPGYSVLDTGKITATLGRPLPEWRDALARYLQNRQLPGHRCSAT